MHAIINTNSQLTFIKGPQLLKYFIFYVYNPMIFICIHRPMIRDLFTYSFNLILSITQPVRILYNSIPSPYKTLIENCLYFCFSVLQSLARPLFGTDAVHTVTCEMINPYRQVLRHVTIPEWIEKIDQCSFYGCPLLSSIIMPNTITEIGPRAFLNCPLLDEITIPDQVSRINYATFLHTGLTKVIIPASVKHIENRAFHDCSKLTDVSASHVTTIGTRAFDGCESLESLKIPACTEISESAFAHCVRLKSLDLSNNNLTTLGQQAFANCDSLTHVKLPGSLDNISFQLFANCRQLHSVTIASGVSTISAESFINCNALTYLKIPSSINAIANERIFDGDSLKYIIAGEQFVQQPSSPEVNREYFFRWWSRGVCTSQTQIITSESMIRGTAYNLRTRQSIHSAALNLFRQHPENAPTYRSLNFCDPISHLPISRILESSPNDHTLITPSFFSSAENHLVAPVKSNWYLSLRPLGAQALACSDVLADWLSPYDLGRIQLASVIPPTTQTSAAFFCLLAQAAELCRQNPASPDALGTSNNLSHLSDRSQTLLNNCIPVIDAMHLPSCARRHQIGHAL